MTPLECTWSVFCWLVSARSIHAVGFKTDSIDYSPLKEEGSKELVGGLHLVLGGLTVAELCQTDGCDEEDLLGQGHLLRGPHRSSRRIGELMAHVIMVLRIISLVLSSVRPHTRSLDIKVGCFFFSRQAGQGIMLALIRGGHSSFFVIHS